MLVLPSIRQIARRFTLMELLIVITIILILAGLLMPALNSSLDSARITSCGSNMKLLSNSCAMYSENYRGFIVPAYEYISTTDRISWDDYISGYDGREPLTDAQRHAVLAAACSLYRCPNEVLTGTDNARSYAVNDGRGAASGMYPLPKGAPTNVWGPTYTQWSARYTQIEKPSQLLLLVDVGGYNYAHKRMGNTDYSSIHSPWSVLTGVYPDAHQERTNYAMVDGHIATLNAYSTTDPSMWRTDVPGGFWARH